MLPPGGRNWQQIFPNYWRFQYKTFTKVIKYVVNWPSNGCFASSTHNTAGINKNFEVKT
jgi:hypothetical protein